MRLNWFHGHQDNRQLPLPLSVKQLLQQAVPCCQHQLISNISHVSSASLHAVLALRDTWCAVQVVLWRHDALRPVLLVRCPIKVCTAAHRCSQSLLCDRRQANKQGVTIFAGRSRDLQIQASASLPSTTGIPCHLWTAVCHCQYLVSRWHGVQCITH